MMNRRSKASGKAPAKAAVKAAGKARGREAKVWIDHDQAVITENGPRDDQTVEHLVRGPAEDEALFDVRAIDEVIDDERVVVSGPAVSRLEFERAYVAVTHRPDRLTDTEERS